MGRLAPWIVLLVLSIVPRIALAFDRTTTRHYFYEAGTELVWEHDKAHCPLHSSTCFVLFPVSTEAGFVEGLRLSRVSQPTGKPWALGQSAADGRFLLYDTRTQQILFSTDDEAIAALRFAALTERPPRFLDATDGEPRRPTLWRTPRSLLDELTCDVPVSTFIWGLFVWPVYLCAMVAYVLLVRGLTRKIGWAPTVLAVLTSPGVPFAFWAVLAMAFS